MGWFEYEKKEGESFMGMSVISNFDKRYPNISGVSYRFCIDARKNYHFGNCFIDYVDILTKIDIKQLLWFFYFKLTNLHNKHG